MVILFFLKSPRDHRHLHSFPTRRSSDLGIVAEPKVHSLALRLTRVAAGKLDVAFASKNSNDWRSEEHTSELQSRRDLVCRLLLEKKKTADAVAEVVEELL